MTHKELVLKTHRWVLRNGGCGVCFHELVSGSLTGEIADVIGFGNYHSVLVEVKVSRADFLKDKNKNFRRFPERGMGKFRYYCCPEGLIKIEDLPEKWGLLYSSEKGRITEIFKATPFDERHIKNENALMYSALRRLNIRGYIEEIYNSQIQQEQTFNIIELENERLEWSLKTFPEATATSSLFKLAEEAAEIAADIENGKREPEEYADALMCLLDSAGRQGISVQEILIAYRSKLDINKQRKWIKNPDNTYSHERID